MTQLPANVADGFRLYQSMPDAWEFSSLDPEDVERVWEAWSDCRYWMERNCVPGANWMDSHTAPDFFSAMRDGYEVGETEGIQTDERDWIAWDAEEKPWVWTPRDF